MFYCHDKKNQRGINLVPNSQTVMVQAAAEKRHNEGDEGAVSRTDPPEASPVRLPGTAVPLGSLLCPLAASSVLGRTPVSRRMYPGKEMDFHRSPHSLIYFIF